MPDKLIDMEVYWVKTPFGFGEDDRTVWQLAKWYVESNCFFELYEYASDGGWKEIKLSEVLDYRHVAEPEAVQL